MITKWTEKDVLEHIKNLKSPFEEQITPPESLPAKIARIGREIIGRKPQVV